MAISSPQVVQRDKQDPMSFMRTGMQLGQMLQQKKMQDMAGAQQILEVLDKTAQASAGGWNGMMKIPGMQESVTGLFQKMGMNPKGAGELSKNLGTLLPNLRGAMEMSQVVQAYTAKGENVPGEVYEQYKKEGITGIKPGPQQPAMKQGPLTGTTYEWEEDQIPQQQQLTAPQPEQKTPEPYMTPQTERPRTTVEQAQTEYMGKLKEMGYDPSFHGTPEEYVKDSPEHLKAIEPYKQKLEEAKQYTGPSVPVDITTPGTVNTVQQKQQVQTGRWTVSEKDVVIGEVRDNIFQPNDQFKWTNETQMLKGLSSQIWGESGKDVETFKNMLYDSAKNAGYKGSKEAFYNPKLGRPSSHGAMMPQWYDWAKEHGIEIKQPVQTPTTEALKYDDSVSNVRVNAAQSIEKKVLPVMEKETIPTDSVETARAKAGEIITTYVKRPLPKSGGRMYDVKQQRITGYIQYDEAKKNEEFLKKHLGHYGDVLFKDEKTYLATMQHHNRIYENLGGDNIMDVLAPNQLQLEKAKLNAQVSQFTSDALLRAEELKAQKGLKGEELRLKRELGIRGIEIEEAKLHLQKLATDAEYGLKWSLAQQQQAEMTNDISGKLFEEGHKMLQLVAKDKPIGDVAKRYADDPLFRLGLTRLLQAEAIQNGKNPQLIQDIVSYEYVKDPGLFQKLGRSLLEPLGMFPGKVPLYGGTALMTEDKQQLMEQQEQFKVEQEKAAEDAEAFMQQWGG